MNKKRKTLFIMVCTIIFFLVLTTFVYAANFATAIGSIANNIDTTNHINNAANEYDSCGYSETRRLIDPGYTLLLSNLAAEVQFFATHGNVDNITFAKSGIMVGGDRTYGTLEYIGTDNVNLWADNTILVTYGGCYTAGNLEFDYSSITHETALKGAEVVLGFKNEIFTDSLEKWAKRYNSKLADGYGVLESAEYANSFSYDEETVKECHIVHHGDSNIKIGSYYMTTSTQLDNVLNEDMDRNVFLSVNEKSMNASDDNIINLLKNKNENFDISNYEIIRKTMGSTNVNTRETKEIEYIDLRFKIGDFITDTGYTIKSKEGRIEEIFDNSIDIELQNELLSKKSEFSIESNVTSAELEKKKEDAIEEVKELYISEQINVDENIPNVKYFYDIENEKKYMKIYVKSENNTDNSNSYAYDTVKYEL